MVEPDKPQMTIQYDARTHTHTQNMYFLSLFYCNNGCTNTPQCYFIRILPVLLNIIYIKVRIKKVNTKDKSVHYVL